LYFGDDDYYPKHFNFDQAEYSTPDGIPVYQFEAKRIQERRNDITLYRQLSKRLKPDVAQIVVDYHW